MSGTPKRYKIFLEFVLELGHFHWICLAKANRGWSGAMIGICPGLRNEITLWIFFIAWFTVETEWA